MKMGPFLSSRHDVVEVPASFCDYFDETRQPDQSGETTEGSDDGTTEGNGARGVNRGIVALVTTMVAVLNFL